LSFADVKEHRGVEHSGSNVGANRSWAAAGRWQEVKVGAEKWGFKWEGSQVRLGSQAPAGSGADLGSEFHYLVLGHQFVRKADSNTYESRLAGSKYQIGHKRPGWLLWSHEYPGMESERDRIERILSREARNPNGIPTSVQVP
jgi:hypothetical protein